MSKAQRQIKQTNIQKQDSVGHHIEHTETVDDNLLPDASEIAKLYQMDPDILQWLKNRAEREQDFRHKYALERVDVLKKNEANTRSLNKFGLTYAFIIFMSGMAFSCFLIYKGHTVTGTIFSGVTLLLAASLFISRKAVNAKNTQPEKQ